MTEAGGIRIILDPVGTGHDWPSGSAQDRRAWAEVIAYSGGNVIFESGVVPQRNGQPVKDATFTKVTEYMPLHGHSSSVPPIVTNNGDGTYAINKLYLFMPGVWWVTLYVQVGSTTDTGKFSFCAGG